MEYHEQFIIDFAKRTRANLEYIEQAEVRGDQVFQVTQLVNSLLGLLVFPRERYLQEIPPLTMQELANRGWPEITTIRGALREDNLRGLTQMLRNSIAHCNVEFVSGSDSQITGLKVWNTNHGRKTWEAEMQISQLRSIVLKFIELLESGERTPEL
jgi:hypothetical protein